MQKIIGIRREDKNEWERRVPLIPTDVEELVKMGIKVIVQPSAIRAFSEDEYQRAGAIVAEDLSPAAAIFAVKEVPVNLIIADKVYTFFSHTIKGQPYNMPMLKTLLEKRCSLIDYERIVDQQNRRLIFFGRYAGLAGMIDSLHALGQKFALQGVHTPLEKIKMAHEYGNLDSARQAISEIGKAIESDGLPPEFAPYTVAFCGYGNVSRGAQEIFDLLPHKVVSPDILLANCENFTADNYFFYKVIFKEEDLVRRINGQFNLEEYYQHPELYQSKFEEYLPAITMMINCIYWTDKYPRLITKEYLQQESILRSNLKLQVIGDISCDIDGSVEITYKATKPDHAFFTYFPAEDSFSDEIERNGITVMAVDNLPCEFSREASEEFSRVLKKFVPEIIAADFNQPFEILQLPFPLKKALIALQGKLTPEYEYLNQFLRQRG